MAEEVAAAAAGVSETATEEEAKEAEEGRVSQGHPGPAETAAEVAVQDSAEAALETERGVVVKEERAGQAPAEGRLPEGTGAGEEAEEGGMVAGVGAVGEKAAVTAVTCRERHSAFHTSRGSGCG